MGNEMQCHVNEFLQLQLQVRKNEWLDEVGLSLVHAHVDVFCTRK